MTASCRSLLNLAYNIYLVEHNSLFGNEIASGYVHRLGGSRPDDFTGTIFETYAAAAFIKAGFELAYENERDFTKTHVEFVATHKVSGKRFSVEVKSRHHGNKNSEGAIVDDVKRLRIGSKLAKALAKKASFDRIVLIEINVPDLLPGSGKTEGWQESAVAQVKNNESALDSNGNLLPPAYVIVTNHSFNAATEIGASWQFAGVSIGFRIPDFGADVVYPDYAALREALERHMEVFALLDSMSIHYEIPATFDGDLPGTLTGLTTPPPRRSVKYRARFADDTVIVGKIRTVSVNDTGLAMCIFDMEDSTQAIIQFQLTSLQIKEYKKYPHTYFGDSEEPILRSNKYVDVCDYLMEVWKDASKADLLSQMQDDPLIHEIKSWSREAVLTRRVQQAASFIAEDI